MRIFLLFLLLFSQYFAGAQDTVFARRTMDTLCSKYFSGRGYIDSGDRRAAHYIAKQFQSYGLQSVKGSYFQDFNFKVNTFPGATDVIIKNRKTQKKLKAGADFLVAPLSGGGKFENLKIIYLDSALLTKIRQKKFKRPHKKYCFVYTEEEIKKTGNNDVTILYLQKPSAIIRITKSKLLWTVSDVAVPIPYIEITKNAWDSTANSITINIAQNFISDYATQNVVAVKISPKNPDSFIIFSAHYDHLGKMGYDAVFPGANDNASGTAMLLDLARTYAKEKDTPKYSMAFIAFAAEEAGLVGSKYFTENPLIPLKNIKFLINMDLMGNGQDGMMTVNGSVFKQQFDTLVSINKRNNYLKEIKQRGKAANSDHYWFTEKGVKAFFFYLLGNYPYYHDIYDTPEKPNLLGYNGALRLIRDFVKAF